MKIIFTLVLFLYFVILYSSNAQLQGQEYIDSLVKELPKIKEDTNKIKLLNSIAFEYYSIAPDEGIKYANTGLELADKFEWSKGKADLYNSLGVLYSFGKSDYPKALEYYHIALKINEDLKDKAGAAMCLSNIGIIYSMQNENVKALEYFQNSLTINENLGLKDRIVSNLGNIGIIYSKTNDYAKALIHFQNSLVICEELNDKSGLAINYGNIGYIYRILTDYLKAIDYYQKALKVNEELGRKFGIASNLGNIGVIYLLLSKDTLIVTSEKGQQIIIEKEKNLNDCIYYLNKTIAIYVELGEIHNKSDYMKSLSEAYEIQGNYKKALEIYMQYKSIQDSIFSVENQIQIANLEAKRENEIKDKEIELLQSEKKAQQLQSYLLFGGIIVLIAASSYALFRFREKKMLSDKLSIQKQKIEEQKLLVEEKNEHIYASIRYASTIQHAILPWDSTLRSAFGEIFIFYKPKDIVSGDCYWFKEVDGLKYLAVIDCTGHGIPGSMLTVIASSVLDDAVLSKRLKDTGEILTYMNQKVTEVLNQRLTENQIRDGMELVLISINNEKIQFSGAGRPLIVKNHSFELFKTDRRSIAGSAKDDNYKFKSIAIDYVKGMTLYLTSDGFADQMNGNRKKYGSRRLMDFLNVIADKELDKQCEILEQELIHFQGNNEQIDDITILGVKL